MTPLLATLASSRQRSRAAPVRQVGGNRPVLKEFGAIVKDAPEPLLVDQLLR